MALFTITSTETTIAAPFLKEPSILELVSVDEHAGQFFQCNHTNLPLVRLLVPLQYGRAQSAMSKTDIFMTLKKLKDVEWHKTLAEANINDKDVRYKDKHVRLKVLQFPSTVVINAPEVGDVKGMTLTVALNQPRLGVVMLLSPAVLEYLRSVVSFQLATGVDKTNAHVRNKIGIDHRVDTRIVNLFWSYDKHKYRAMFFPVNHNGKRMRRTQFHTGSLDAAKHFLETGDRPEKKKRLRASARVTHVASLLQTGIPAPTNRRMKTVNVPPCRRTMLNTRHPHLRTLSGRRQASKLARTVVHHRLSCRM